MNIQISDSWLREFIDTKATPEQIREYLSLCSQSVEKLIKDGDDFIYDIEITTNRPDCLSVYGIARELSAVLPRFGIEALLKEIPVSKIPKITDGLQLTVKIAKNDLCPRFTALIYDNIKIKPSPVFVQKRLNQSGIRALNNVIDISNYLMLELGQPMHTFDYDKILKNKMILRESKEREEIVTLDNQTRKLKEGIIIIEDGEGRIVDLCGIMGAKNSETDENTKRVLLFVQTYNPMKIRKACQLLNFRTEAASRFEKGLDAEGVIESIQRATMFFEQWCEGKTASRIFDIYPNPQKEKTVSVSSKKIDQIIGLEIKIEEAKSILDNLGFKTKIEAKNEILTAVVPHWRYEDINIPEDLVEEIARIYGYHNLPDILPPLRIVPIQDEVFFWENKIKIALKYWGWTETVNYSLVGKNMIGSPDSYLKLSNPLSEDLVYLRQSLIPSLLNVISKNQTEKNIRIYEMANIYLSQKENQLPAEIMTLTLAMTGENDNKYFELKGAFEALIGELGIEKYEIKPGKSDFMINFGLLFIKDTNVGIIGETSQNQLSNNTNERVFILDIELKKLLNFAVKNKKYLPVSKFPAIIEDLSFLFTPQTRIADVIDKIKQVSELVNEVKLIDSFENTKTFRIKYQSIEKNLTDSEVKIIREKIIKCLEKPFGILLKTKE